MTRGRPKTYFDQERSCENPSCGRSFVVQVNSEGRVRGGTPGRCCSRPCARAIDGQRKERASREAYTLSPVLCPCGEPIEYERRHTAKYHEACRGQRAIKRQKDPGNYVIFPCEGCGQEVMRYKKYGNGALRFCSNECSAKSNTQRRIGVDDVVLDSGYEALFWGLCMLHKIPIKRFDRAGCIPFGDGWYGPDFVAAGFTIEVKGREDDDDRERCIAWRSSQETCFVVLDEQELRRLIRMERDPIIVWLGMLAEEQETAFVALVRERLGIATITKV